MHSPDLSQDNIAKIRALFPDCVTEAADDQGSVRLAVDFDQLRQQLSDHIVEGPQERYRLDWPGKREALLTANAPIAKTLRPAREESVDFDTTQNLFIEGDNLDALKLLQESYLGKVKMIYIDPPYNTGNDFIYEDDFSETTRDFLARSNQADENGGRLVANTDSNGRFHSDWLSMMMPRLKLSRNLLSNNGAIFISLDDGEYGSLRKICDEIFGSQNFICTVIWQKVFSPKNTAAFFSEDHDYIAVYAKDKNEWRPSLLPRSAESIARYQNQDRDERGPWLSGALQARNYYSKGQYEVESPSGAKFSNPKGTYWRFSKERFLELDADRRIWWGERGDGVPRLKRFLSEVKDGVVPQTLWKFDLVGHTQEAKEEFNKYVEFDETENVLNSLKPSRLLKHAIRIGTNSDSNDIVLDFFAGSGPSAHGLLSLNAEDGGNRRFIAVQIAEALPAADAKAGSIADFARSRLRNVGAELTTGATAHEKWNRDVGFRVLKTDSSNMTDVFYRPDEVTQDLLFGQIDSVKADRTDEDLLFQVLIDWGVELSLPINRETLHGKTVYSVDGNALIACFEPGVTDDLVKDIAARAPLRAVFRDTSFARDADRINAEQLFRQLSPGTELKAI